MIIDSLKLTNFRNFEKYNLALDKVNVLVGPNGVGKTNVVEAIFILSVCRSYRTRRDTEVIRWHEATARISADLNADSADMLKIAVAQDGDKKIAFASDKAVPVSLLVGKLPTVLFAPEIMELPVDLPAKRRRSLDILTSQTKLSYTRWLLEYNRVLKARSKLLDGIADGRNKPGELEFWDKELVRCGERILKKRLEIVASLNKVLDDCFSKINNAATKGKRHLELKYLATVSDAERYDEELEAAKERDLRYRNTTCGPHRDDWQLTMNGIDVRMAASRGETRTVLLALKMAEVGILRDCRHETPVILLDDVFAELDKHHSEALIDLIDDAQVVITATDAEYIPKKIKDVAKITKIDTI